MPENIEKNMYLRRRQSKITLLRCQKKKNFCLNHTTKMSENIEENIYFRRRQGKIKLL